MAVRGEVGAESFFAAAAQEKTAATGEAENRQKSQGKTAENRGKLRQKPREVAENQRKNRAGEPVGKWGERAAKMGAEWVGCCCGGATKKWPQQRGETGELAEEPGKNGGRTGKMGG